MVQPHQIFVVALYWAVMTMSTIGYGDVQAQTTLERSYVIGCMVVGASVYAYMVGAVCGIVASMYALLNTLPTQRPGSGAVDDLWMAPIRIFFFLREYTFLDELYCVQLYIGHNLF